MKIMIFTEGTILMHKNAVDHSREEIVQQVLHKELSVQDYTTYIPVDNAPKKVEKWVSQGAEIVYMTSRREKKEIDEIQNVLDIYKFPKGILEYRKEKEEYKDVAERIMPDILIEDDCESIGENEITYPHINPEPKKKMKSVIVKEFSGIDYLSDDITRLIYE